MHRGPAPALLGLHSTYDPEGVRLNGCQTVFRKLLTAVFRASLPSPLRDRTPAGRELWRVPLPPARPHYYSTR